MALRWYNLDAQDRLAKLSTIFLRDRFEQPALEREHRTGWLPGLEPGNPVIAERHFGVERTYQPPASYFVLKHRRRQQCNTEALHGHACHGDRRIENHSLDGRTCQSSFRKPARPFLVPIGTQQ